MQSEWIEHHLFYLQSFSFNTPALTQPIVCKLPLIIMKRLFFALSILTSLTAFSQDECQRNGAIQATDVTIGGTASLIYRGDSLVVVLGSDFATESGPDLDVYLSNEPNPVSTGIKLSALGGFFGKQAYEVSPAVNIEDYRYISIHCTQYNHLFGYADLGEPTGECSTALTSVDVKLGEIKVVARKGSIRVRAEGLSIANFRAEIYNQNGQLVGASKDYSYNQPIDTAGFYFVKLYSDTSIRTEKVIVK